MEQKFISGYNKEFRDMWNDPENWVDGPLPPQVQRLRDRRRLTQEARAELDGMKQDIEDYKKAHRQE